MPLYCMICDPAGRPMSVSSEKAIYCSPMDFFYLPSVYSLWENCETPITLNDFPDKEQVKREMRDRLDEIVLSLQQLLFRAQFEEFRGKEVDDEPDRYGSWLGHSEHHESPRPATTSPISIAAWEGNPLPDLSKVTKAFLCATCDEPLVWPELLEHPHIRNGPYPTYFLAGRTIRFDPKQVRANRLYCVIMQRTLHWACPRILPQRS